jgi:hypothetical protein
MTDDRDDRRLYANFEIACDLFDESRSGKRYLSVPLAHFTSSRPNFARNGR